MGQPPATLENWRSAPHSRWAFHHVRELIPTADIPNDPRRIRELPAQERDLGQFRPFMEATATDGLLVLHRGRIVLEHYAHGMSPDTPHILMSVSKSMLGLLFVELGLDARQRVTDVLAQLRGSAYEGASLRHLLDMRAAIAFNEDYLAREGPIIEYRKATGWNPLAPGDTASDLHSFYMTLKARDGEHGGRFHYVSPNADLLGWAIESMTGRRYAELVSERLWRPAGAERSAYITVDRLGAPRCAGGMCATLRDLGRVGLWLMEERAAFLDDLERHGDPAAWAAGDLAPYYPGLAMRYRNQWYLMEGEAPLAFGMGIHGQNLFVDRVNRIVIAKLSSQALPLDAGLIGYTMQTLARLREVVARG